MLLKGAHVKTDWEREQCVAMRTAGGLGMFQAEGTGNAKPYDRNTSKYSRNSKGGSMMPPTVSKEKHSSTMG